MRWWICAALILLTACQPASSDPASSQNGNLSPDSTLIQWDRSPTSVVFRADVIGGDDAFSARSAIPLCTVYGDNRVVWINELDGFNIEILHDRVSDDAVRSFVEYLTVNERVYTYDWQFDDILAAAEVAPVAETVSVEVNGLSHRADAFSGWDPEWFRRVLDACKSISATPVLFQPDGGWLLAQVAPYNSQAPIIEWDAAAAGFSLDTVVDGDPRWMTGAPMLTLWDDLRRLPSSLLYLEGDAYYTVALQIPGITRDSPPAP